MELKLYLRTDFMKKLRPLLITDKCDGCGSVNNLELHHKEIHFATILNTTLELLDLPLHKDTDSYSSEELDKIRFIMLGKQSCSKYSTLCPICHYEVHTYEGKDLTNYYKWLENKRSNKLKMESDNIKYNITPYLESNVGVRLNNEDKKELISIFNKRDGRNRLQKSISILNQYMTDNDIPYIIKSKKARGRVDGDEFIYRFWIIECI